MDGISIDGMTQEEAREKILDQYGWDMKVTYNDKEASVGNLLEGRVDELLEEIYGGSTETTFEVNTDNLLDAALKNQEFKNNYVSQNMCYTIADMSQGVLRNPKGVFYMSSNSATGSKFYELIPQQQDYIAARSQTWRPTYSVIRITNNSFTINTYDAETGTPIDSSYSIIKD